MAMKSMRGGKVGGFLKYVVFGILGMAVGGLVISGSFSGGNVGGNDVAKIEDKAITIRQFDMTLRRTLARYNMSTEQAYKIGMAEDVLAGEIRSYFMLKEAENLGIEIDQDQLAKRIGEVIAPHKKEGQTLQQALEEILRRQGMNEKDFVNGIKREVSGDIISNAIQTGFAPATDLLAKDLYAFQTQTRDIDIILFNDSEITDIPAAETEELERLYESIKFAQYEIPEYRSFDIALFDPESIKVEFSVSEEDIEAFYGENEQSFAVGEQFVLTQAILDNKQSADDVYALVEKGLNLKDATTQIMGEKARYIENIPFETSAMLPALSKALEKREIGKVVAPANTALGYHIVKLEKILPPSTQPLKTVATQIKKELLEVKQSDHLYGISTTFEELLNDEISFEEIAKEIDISVSSVGLIDAAGADKADKSGLAEFVSPADKEALVEMVFAVEEDMSPMLEELPSGKFVSIRLSSKENKTYKPFESVRAEISQKFIADQRHIENKKRMDKYLAELDVKGSTFEGIAKENKKKIQTIKSITIEGDIPAPLLMNNRPLIFKTAVGGHQALMLDGQYALMKVADYNIPEINESNEKTLETIKDRVDSEAKDEALLAYLHMLSNKYNATINTQLLERAYGQKNNEN
ncbi:MAG: hypothetical protein COA45_09890 [Zetaproteobacteria bacterium]|nr:MAG: hypothetical protein COA45_09890 [Zetaproteobacteria bacterium]